MEDDKIKSFFKAMKTADEQLAVPPFLERKEPRRLLPVFLYGAAAAIVHILITIHYVAPSAASETAPVIEIDVFVDQDPLTSQSLLERDGQDLSTWESPTGFLSEYY